jgi:hypothetical protein
LTAHGHRQILSIRTQSDLICAPRLLIAEQPRTVQIGGSGVRPDADGGLLAGQRNLVMDAAVPTPPGAS